MQTARTPAGVTSRKEVLWITIQSVVGCIVGVAALWFVRPLFAPGVQPEVQMFYINLYFGVAGCIVASIYPEYFFIAPVSIVIGNSLIATLGSVPLSSTWPLSFLTFFFFIFLNSTYAWVGSAGVCAIAVCWSRWRSRRGLETTPDENH